MADKIRLLPEVVANQIAAGEVVNRPASVVKEMMENALDAGARMVKVNFRDGGKDLIQIVDDGCGMSPIDARMAFDRHATSKISAVDDIYALQTFGFRGEALASIAAVAQVELRTRQADAEVGTVTEINGGKFVAQTPIACPVGSQFFVRNLFYNVPARRRFLDKSTTSASQIKAEFQRVALCNPQVAFELYANDAPVYTLGATSLAGRIVDVVGRHIKQNLLEIEADTSIASVVGYIGRPAAAKKRNSEQYLFVNGRYFKSGYLTSAILKAYEKLIPESAQPSYFLYLTIDPSRIDVNVHPQKTEVRFADEAAVWQIVNAAVRETLAKTGAVPMMDFDRAGSVDIPVLQQGAIYREPRAMSNNDYNPFREEYIDQSATDPNIDFTGFDVPYDGDSVLSDVASESLQRQTDRTAQSRGVGKEAMNHSFLSDVESLGDVDAAEEFDDFVSGADLSNVSSKGCGVEFAESDLDFIPSSAEAEQQSFQLESPCRFSEPLLLNSGYAVAKLDQRVVFIDLRRAYERILYEEYLGMLKHGSAVSQQLLFPERLVLSSDEYALLEEHAVELAALGFDVDYLGEDAVNIKGTPADLSVDMIDRLIFELLQAFATPVSIEDMRREKVAAVMARQGAKSTLRISSREEVAALLDRLSATGNVSFSPTGKAIVAEISMDEIRAKLN